MLLSKVTYVSLKTVISVGNEPHSQSNIPHLSPVGAHTAEVIQVTEGIRKAAEAHAGFGPPYLQAHIIRGWQDMYNYKGVLCPSLFQSLDVSYFLCLA